jgi:glyoxylase-like metal-dependent hydrolase (beta-lactamase superfamily II)
MFLKNKKNRILLITFIIVSMVLPVIPVEAKKTLPESITVERINSRITHFEETIPLNIPGLTPPGAYYRVSVFAVKLQGGIILVDCGDEALAADLYKTVTSTFGRPIKGVYLTHYHADHAGGGAYFQSKDIPVYSPMMEAWFIVQGANVSAGIPDAFTYSGYVPNGYYENTELYKEFGIIPAPGHTMGAVHIEFKKGGKSYLFAADTILPMETDMQSPLDFTYLLTTQTAYQNYMSELAGYGPFCSGQLDTLNNLQASLESYDMVLAGHTPELEYGNAALYVGYTIGTLMYFPYI